MIQFNIITFDNQEDDMKLLLTSGGITNESIYNALVSMLDKPIEACKALCIPTAGYAMQNGIDYAWNFISGKEESHMCDLGWKSIGVLELTALPSVSREIWEPKLREADVILVNGGDPLYLNHWFKQSGVAELLPSLKVVYVGLSAGSMIMAPRIGEFFVDWQQPSNNDETLGMVDFSIFPHLEHIELPANTLVAADQWANTIKGHAFAIDDATAIKVVDNKIEIISEGIWKEYGK